MSHYIYLIAEGKDLRTAVFQGSMERLNPILMTALTAGLALIPLALGGGEPGKEIQTPMAIVILGGLLTSTFLNMVVVPALFMHFGEREPLSRTRMKSRRRQSGSSLNLLCRKHDRARFGVLVRLASSCSPRRAENDEVIEHTDDSAQQKRSDHSPPEAE